MALTQEVQENIALASIFGFTNIHLFSPAQTRESMKHIPPLSNPTPVGTVVNTKISEGNIPIRIYTPEGNGPFPVVSFFHGGGFAIMSLDSHDEICRQLCTGSGAVVMSVDYRLAPEYPYPAGPEDCITATRWMMANAKNYHGIGEKMAVAGDSAGGYMALYVAQQLSKDGIRLCAQFAAYPVTDHYTAKHLSYTENEEGYTLSAGLMKWFWDNYIIDESKFNEASPLRSADFSKLPPSLIMTCNYDPLRDEGKAYADKLQLAGIETTYKNYENVHGFLGIGTMGLEAMKTACDFLKSSFLKSDQI